MKLYWALTKGHHHEAVTVALAEDREEALERINHRLATANLSPFDECLDTLCEVMAKPSCFLLMDPPAPRVRRSKKKPRKRWPKCHEKGMLCP